MNVSCLLFTTDAHNNLNKRTPHIISHCVYFPDSLPIFYSFLWLREFSEKWSLVNSKIKLKHFHTLMTECVLK